MLHQLKRHPFAVSAQFEHCLVLTYAAAADVLDALLPPGLELDRLERRPDLGFLAIGFVQTRDLRPAGAPSWAGQDFFLSGYRIFARFRTPRGRLLRGLRILRSDTDSRAMTAFGNLLTHYHYQKARVDLLSHDGRLEITVSTPHSEADLRVVADISNADATLPDDSCFESLVEARRFAGPLPYTFDYEPETHSIIAIRATRRNWLPRLVNVHVERCTFFEQGPLLEARPVLVSAYYQSDISYCWERGVRYDLRETVR